VTYVGMLDERPAAADRLHQVALAELGERFAHDRTADAELTRERVFGRQPRSRFELAGQDPLLDLLGQRLEEAQTGEWLDGGERGHEAVDLSDYRAA
jgi:hypothetical protein